MLYNDLKAKLESNGVNPSMAEAILKEFITIDLPKQDTKVDIYSDYPECVVRAVYLSVRVTARKYIGKHHPQAWFRPMFE